MPADREALHVLEYEGAGVELCDDADEFPDQAVARVVERAVADQREALAGRAAEHAVDRAPVDPRQAFAMSSPVERLERMREGGRFREVEFVDGAMHRVDLDCRGHVEAGLLEAETQPARPGE